MYFLRSARLGFRCWTVADFERANAIWGDAEVMRLLGGALTAEQVRERLAREIASQEAHGIQYWPIFLVEESEHIGCCGLRPYQPEARILEMGFHLRPAYWGRGLASEAARTAAEYAFATLGAAGLFAGHHPENDASWRVLEKLGFRYAYDTFYPPTGLPHPSYLLMREHFTGDER